MLPVKESRIAAFACTFRLLLKTVPITAHRLSGLLPKADSPGSKVIGSVVLCAEHLCRGYSSTTKLWPNWKLPVELRVFELTGYIVGRQGKSKQGVHNLERAVELDPRNFFTLQQIALSYPNLHHYSDETAVLDRALSIVPDDLETRAVRALVDFDWKTFADSSSI